MLARTCLLALSLLSTLLLPVHAEAAPRYKITVLPQRFSPVDINNAGVMAGNIQATETESHAALLIRGKIIDLGTLGGPNSSANALNEAGQVTGSSTTRDAGTIHAFLYSRGRMIDIDGRGPALFSTGIGINARGQVTGQYLNRNNRLHAYLYSGRGLQDLGTLGGDVSFGWDLNDAGVVVGESVINDPASDPFPPFHPFVYRKGVMRDLGVLQGGGHTANAAQEINNAGQIAGYSEVDGAFHLFFYERGMMTDLGFFGGRQLSVTDMNERGSFVGTAQAPGDSVPFLYAGGTLYDINTLIVSPNGWRISGANGINDHGQIVGGACRQDTCVPVRLDPVYGHR
jgi:probable HAF family extracellular repeat protein